MNVFVVFEQQYGWSKQRRVIRNDIGKAIRANHVWGHHNELGCYFKCHGKLLEGCEQQRPMP